MSRARAIPSLTGLRGIAAAGAALFHFRQQLYPLDGYAGGIRFAREMGRGWHAVDLFFMLSGLVLMHVHERDFEGWSAGRLARFAWLRFTRVYPLNAAVLVLIAVLLALQPGFKHQMQESTPLNYSLANFVHTLTLTTRFPLHRVGEWNGVTWSLSLEVLAYLAFPVLAFLAARIGRRWECVTLILAALGVPVALDLGFHNGFIAGPVDGWGALSRTAVCFFSGMMVQRLAVLCGEAGGRYAPALALLSVAGVLCGLKVDTGDLYFNPSFAVLLFGLYYQRGRVAELLSTRLAMFLGGISFPLYLVHLVALQWTRYLLVSRHVHGSRAIQVEVATAWFAGCLGLSTMLHYWVEIPAHAFGRRISSYYFPSKSHPVLAGLHHSGHSSA